MGIAADWVQRLAPVWSDIESSMPNFPLKNVLFVEKLKTLRMSCSSPLTLSTVRACPMVLKLNRSQLTSLFTPLSDNPLFLSGTTDSGFLNWAANSIFTFSDLTDGSNLISFAQLIDKYNIHRSNFFPIFIS